MGSTVWPPSSPAPLHHSYSYKMRHPVYGNVPPQVESTETPMDATMRLQYNRAWDTKRRQPSNYQAQHLQHSMEFSGSRQKDVSYDRPNLDICFTQMGNLSPATTFGNTLTSRGWAPHQMVLSKACQEMSIATRMRIPWVCDVFSPRLPTDPKLIG